MAEAGTDYDLLVIGGGINGTGVARDAAGRGLSVLLVEKNDLAAATSSWSSKLIHGGLRYLEQYQFRLVAEALAEREILLHIAPHLVKPLRFVMPHVPQLRPRWIIRAGLFLYDHLGHRAVAAGPRETALEPSRAVELRQSPFGSGLRADYAQGYVYSDCQVDDARLVLANALSATECGASILTRTECIDGRRRGDAWELRLRTAEGSAMMVSARAVVNAAGPWVKAVLDGCLHQASRDGLRLVKGSHIVVPRAYPGEHAYILQNDDRRVVFLIPYLQRFTLIGTTDIPVDDIAEPPAASPTEVDYLCRAANRYLEQPIAAGDVIWSYAGIRPLYDDGHRNPSTVTRDYTLRVTTETGAAPLLSVFGGKITTYRRLAEHVLEQLKPWFRHMGPSWTAGPPLPGGDSISAAATSPWQDLHADLLDALRGRHGSRVAHLLLNVAAPADMGRYFGAQLYAREIDYMIEHEWARSADDILYRRSKAGLMMNEDERTQVRAYVAARLGTATAKELVR